MVTFVDERIDENVEKGAQGGPSFLTTVIELANANEQRNQEWVYPRQDWDISYGIQTAAEFQQIIDMFYACRGRLFGFRFKDWIDFNIGPMQAIGVGDGVNPNFQMFKQYLSPLGSQHFNRPITRPVQGTVSIYVNGVLKVEGVDYSINYDTGLIVFMAGHIPPLTNVVQLTGQFDVPVRFDSDMFKMRVEWSDALELPTIRIIELKEYSGLL